MKCSLLIRIIKPKLSVNTGSALVEYIRYPSREWKQMAVFKAINVTAELSALLTPNSTSPHQTVWAGAAEGDWS